MSYLPDKPVAIQGCDDLLDLSPAAKTLLVRIDDLAVLPHVVFKVLDLSGSDDSCATDLERVIQVDPAFSMKLLVSANSSFYSLSKKVTSVREAIMYLGFRTVRDIAMTIGVFDMFVGKNDKESLRRRAWWRHSLDTATCARYIADRCRKVDSDEAYTCGLLHYIGKPLLDRSGGTDYALVERLVDLGSVDVEAERRVYGCDHQEISRGAGAKWGLPGRVFESFGYLSPCDAELDYSMHRATVAIASAIAKQGVQGASSFADLPEWAMSQLGLDPSEGQDLYDCGLQRIVANANLHF